jgi:hypothetical protein
VEERQSGTNIGWARVRSRGRRSLRSGHRSSTSLLHDQPGNLAHAAPNGVPTLRPVAPARRYEQVCGLTEGRNAISADHGADGSA